MVLPLLVPLCLLVLLGYVFYSRFDLPAAFCPIASVSAVVLFLLLAGSFNLLAPGCWLLMALMAAAGGIELFRKEKRFSAYILSPGMLAFLAGAVVLFAAYGLHGHFYTQWDEYSHWGPCFKDIYMNGALHQFTGLELVHHSYPQGSGVLYYFFSRFAPAYSEAHTYAAIGVWLCAASATLCAGQSWKRPVAALLTVLAAPLFFILFPYSDPYITVYMDTLLGAVFGAGLVMAIYPGPRRFSYCGLAGLVLGALCHIKDSGIFLALVAAGVYLAVAALGQSGANAGPPADERKNIAITRGLKTGLFLACAFLPAVVWRVFLALTHTPANRFADPTGQDLPGLLAGAATGQNPTAASIVERYFINLRVAPVVYNGYGTSLFMGVILTAAGIALAFWLWRKQKRGPAVGVLLAPAGFAVYLAGMLAMYLAVLSEAEALRGASFERYMSTYFIGWCMLLLGAVLFYTQAFFSKAPGAVPAAALAAVLALQLNAALGRDVLDVRHQKESGRYGFEAVSAQMLAELSPEDRVWVVAQGADNMYTYMFHYNLMPAKVDLWLPSQLGGLPPDPQNYVELAAAARTAGVDYLLVYITDDGFDEKYKAGFSDELDSVRQNSLPSLYRVQPEGEPVPFQLVVATKWAV